MVIVVMEELFGKVVEVREVRNGVMAVVLVF